MNQVNVKSIRSAISQLAPLQRVRNIEAQAGTPPDEISDLELELGALCRKQAAHLCQQIDLNGENAEWAESYFSSHIANMIAERWAEDPVEAKTFNYTEHLASIAAEPMYAGLPSSWIGTSGEVSYITTTLAAISRAMQAYHKFNLFHFDKTVIQNFFTEQIITTAQEATRIVSPALSVQMDVNNAASLYQTFIKQSGTVLSDLWRAASIDVLSQYQLGNEEQKQLLRTPYDLDALSQQLTQSMTELANAALQSLNAVAELSNTHSHSPA